MKFCPTCKIEYLDTTLEFCLEDGSRLRSFATDNSPNEKTDVLHNYSMPASIVTEISNKTNLQNNVTDKLANLKEKAAHQGYKVIEIAPIVLALAHNYWQWLYLTKSYYGDTISFLTSGHFSVWLCLLVVGTITSFIALKYGKNKGFAVTGLIIMAINLLLSIVPSK